MTTMVFQHFLNSFVRYSFGRYYELHLTKLCSVSDFDFDFDFDDTRFRSFQSQDHVQVLKTETDWPRWYGDGANQIIIVTKTGIGLGGAKQIVNVTI